VAEVTGDLLQCSITECNMTAEVYISRPTVKDEDDLFRVGSSHEEMKRVSVQESFAAFPFVVVSCSCLKSKPQILKYR
jgi:hypothetical protein